MFSATKLSTHYTALCFLGHVAISLLLSLFITLECLLFAACILTSDPSSKVTVRFHLGGGVTHSYLQQAAQLHFILLCFCYNTYILCYHSYFCLSYFEGTNYCFSSYYLNSEHNTVYLVAFNKFVDYLIKVLFF